MTADASQPRYRTIEEIDLLDLESVRLLLRGGSVIDWQRLAFTNEADVREFLVAQELDPADPASHARTEALKNQAIAYLKRNFDFPVPKPIAEADVGELLLIASGRGHRQLCACTILKVMHVIHHLEARELLSMLPISDQDVFHLVEKKVYRVIGGMMARGLPILEFVGGRKNKDSLYSKLLSKRETHAAQIYDKLRFRVVVREVDDIFPVLAYLARHLFPFNYIVPGESTNTMFDLASYARSRPHLAALAERLQRLADDAEGDRSNDNVFSAPTYSVVHFVADMPVRLPAEVLEEAPPAAWALGHVVFAQAEFQIVDRETEQRNELGEASHEAYKARQRQAVMRRLKVGNLAARSPSPQTEADGASRGRSTKTFPKLGPESDAPPNRANRQDEAIRGKGKSGTKSTSSRVSDAHAGAGKLAAGASPGAPTASTRPPGPASRAAPSDNKPPGKPARNQHVGVYAPGPRTGNRPKVSTKLRRNLRPKR